MSCNDFQGYPWLFPPFIQLILKKEQHYGTLHSVMYYFIGCLKEYGVDLCLKEMNKDHVETSSPPIGGD